MLVGVGEHPGVGLLHPGGDPLFVGAQVVPLGYAGVERGEFGVGGNDADVLLAVVALLADGPPAGVVATVVAVDVGLGDVDGVVAGAEAQVQEEGALGPRRGLGGDHGDGLVHQILGDVVAGPVGPVDVVVVGHQVGVPLVGGPVQEAVIPVEPPLEGPLVEWAGGGGVLDGGQVPLAHGEGGIARRAQHLGQGGRPVGDAAGAAGEAGVPVADHGHAHRVVVAPGEQARPGGRADGGGVEVVVAQAVGGEGVHGGGVDL